MPTSTPHGLSPTSAAPASSTGPAEADWHLRLRSSTAPTAISAAWRLYMTAWLARSLGRASTPQPNGTSPITRHLRSADPQVSVLPVDGVLARRGLG
jgi:hypothetical protein